MKPVKVFAAAAAGAALLFFADGSYGRPTQEFQEKREWLEMEITLHESLARRWDVVLSAVRGIESEYKKLAVKAASSQHFKTVYSNHAKKWRQTAKKWEAKPALHKRQAAQAREALKHCSSLRCDYSP